MILVFDTATMATVVACGEPNGDSAELRHDPVAGERPAHTPQLLTLAREVLRTRGASFSDVTRIGVGVGPGSFTGLRVGVSTARSLALATGAELVAVGSLAALAWPFRESAVTAAIDARRGEVFLSSYDSGVRTRGAEAIASAALADLDGAGPVVGDGAIRYRTRFEAGGFDVPPDESREHLVGSPALLALAAAGDPVAVDSLTPDYIRVPDATPR